MESLPKLLNVVPRPGFCLDVEYSDGATGTVDLSDLAGRGVFVEWETPGSFEGVSIGPNGQLVWSEAIELCADAIYLRLTGKSSDEATSGLDSAQVDA